MRFLHTSDWHIGRTFHGHDLLADQEFVLSALADLAREHQVDAVVIAGDIYDRAVPSAEAVQVATRALQRIRQSGAALIASSGNHDSAPRLGAFAEFLAAGGLHLRTAVDAVANPVLLSDEAGQVAVYAVPYLEPEIAKHALGVPGRPGHQAVMAAAMGRVRADLAARPVGTRSVVLAHAFVVGGTAGGSERSIAVGGVESVTSDLFAGIDYVALGHLHGAQSLTSRIRYSGSPLPYSFAESGKGKGVWLIDLDAEGTVVARWLELPTVRPLARITGPLADVLMGHFELTDSYVSVVLTDAVRPLEPMRLLKERYPYVLTISWEPSTDHARFHPPSRVVSPSTDAETLSCFVLDCRGSIPSGSERVLLQDALTAERLVEMSG